MTEPPSPPTPPEAPPPPPPPESPPPASPPPPPPPSPDGAGPTAAKPQGEKALMLALAYAWILALIPFLIEKDDAEVQWHAKHGLVILGLEIAVSIGLMILSAIPVLGCLFGIASILIFLGFVILRVVLFVKALKGERQLIPGVSQYADKF